MKLWKSLPVAACVLAAILSFAAARAGAAAVDVKIDIPALRCIQANAIGEGKADEVYLLVTGVAKGGAFTKQYPESKTLKSEPKTPPIDDKSAVIAWEGKLEEGEFVVVNVALFAGTKADGKTYLEKKAASDKAVELLGKKTTTDKGVDELRKAVNKASLAFFKGIDEMYPKGKGDAFVGSFDVIVANVGGEVLKRGVPVGLLSGEHYGIKPKRYTKIKYTRENVLLKDAQGRWYEAQVEPVSLDEDRLRVKATEVEKVDIGAADPVTNVTDYLFEVRVHKAGKAEKWLLAGDHPGPSIVHDYWDWAE